MTAVEGEGIRDGLRRKCAHRFVEGWVGVQDKTGSPCGLPVSFFSNPEPGAGPRTSNLVPRTCSLRRNDLRSVRAVRHHRKAGRLARRRGTASSARRSGRRYADLQPSRPETVLSRLFEVYRFVPSAGSMATQVGPAPTRCRKRAHRARRSAGRGIDRVALDGVRVVVDHVEQLARGIDRDGRAGTARSRTAR